MRHIETDYLVIGAGASGMAFTDTLVAETDADVILVDRRHRPGGHWLDAYPFVRLHQPSACYGVASRELGQLRIDSSGVNAGFYERASAAEIVDYYGRVLDETLEPSGQVRFFGNHDYVGEEDGHHRIVSRLTGEAVAVTVRRRLVDATYTESSIPSRHTPGFAVDPAVAFVPPNALVDLDRPAGGFTVIGGGKTAADTCNWLLDQGYDPDRIRWVRCRDPWMFDRAHFQPLDLVAGTMEMQAAWVAAAAEAADGAEFCHRLEDAGVMVRIDPTVEPQLFRGATISRAELEALRTIDDVVRLGRVSRVDRDVITLEQGTLPARPGEVYVDCTAPGVRATPPMPIFAPGRITLQYTTVGVVPWGAAVVAKVEASRDDDAEKNRLCPVVTFTGDAARIMELASEGMAGLMARGTEADLAAWDAQCRLNPARGAAARADDPRVAAAFAAMGRSIGAALRNLAAHTTPVG